ncbi:MAG TPA: GspH/FimT family pseudopilin [Burkholderiales bacterium]
MNRLGSNRFPRPLAAFRGFTLQEMLVSLCISGTLVGGGAGMWNVFQQDAVTASANDLAAHLALARSESITTNEHLTLCPTDDQQSCLRPGDGFTDWHKGWLVYADKNHNGKPDGGEIVRVQGGVTRGIRIRSSRARSRVTYQPMGTAGGSTITFAVCGERDPSLARYVIVSNSGRARVAQTTTSNIKCA